MDQKWVIAWRDGLLVAARSWSGQVQAVARAHQDGERLVVESLHIAEGPLEAENSVEVFDWLIRSHVLNEKLPFPLDEGNASILEAVPLTAFSGYGNVIFCAARTWSPPPSTRPLRSTGRVVQSLRAGELDDVATAVESGADIDAPSAYEGYTALHFAIVQNDRRAIDKLLALGADINREVDSGMFALGMAIVNGGDEEVLDVLEAAGAELGAVNNDGFGAIHAAAETGNRPAIQWLTQRALDLNQRTNAGHTAFHVACALGHLEAAKLLATLGADITIKSATGETSLEIAQNQNQTAVVEWLRSHRDV